MALPSVGKGGWGGRSDPVLVRIGQEYVGESCRDRLREFGVRSGFGVGPGFAVNFEN